MRRRRQQQQQQQQQRNQQDEQQQQQQGKSKARRMRRAFRKLTGRNYEDPTRYYEKLTRNSVGLVLGCTWEQRLFLPTCGVLSKARAIHWGVIERDVLPQLSKAAVDAKEQEYNRRMLTIEGELAKLARESNKVDRVAVHYATGRPRRT
jgi:hypothetical protein